MSTSTKSARSYLNNLLYLGYIFVASERLACGRIGMLFLVALLWIPLPDKHRIPIGQLSFQFEGIDDYSEEGYEHLLCEMRILS